MTPWMDRARIAGGVFVTGTDTGVGKTVVSALLARWLDADYWKPVQTGTADGDDDSATVTDLTGAHAHPVAHAYGPPLSPHEAARWDGGAIALEDFGLPRTERPLVVEGAGGVLVPLNDDGDMMLDLIARLGLPVVVVARSGLGTINHTLLTLAALMGRKIEVLGVVLVGEGNPANRATIERYSALPVIAEVPRLDAVTPEALAEMNP